MGQWNRPKCTFIEEKFPSFCRTPQPHRGHPGPPIQNIKNKNLILSFLCHTCIARLPFKNPLFRILAYSMEYDVMIQHFLTFLLFFFCFSIWYWKYDIFWNRNWHVFWTQYGRNRQLQKFVFRHPSPFTNGFCFCSNVLCFSQS